MTINETKNETVNETVNETINEKMQRFAQHLKFDVFCFFLFLKEKEAKRTSLQNRFAVLLSFTMRFCVFFSFSH